MFDKIHPEEIEELTRKKIYDPFLRILHAWNGICVFLLILTMIFKEFMEETPHAKEIIYTAHIYIGIGLSGGILLRLIWGFIGTEHAKIKNFFFLKDWIQLIKKRKIDTNMSWGHDKYASFAYLTVYLVLIYQAITGLIFSARFFAIGPFSYFVLQSDAKSPILHELKEIHEFFFYVLILYIIVHVGMIYIHEKKNKFPIAQSMFSGYQYRKKK
jgi:Ni/Fe-hydrogenase 1 B-type cytochrome subunit